MVVEDTSETSDWVNRLAKVLDNLVESITAVRINLPTLTNSEYRALGRQANRNANAHLLFEEYLPKLGSEPTDAIGVLQEHPVMRREVEVSGGKPAVMMLMPPGDASRVELDRLTLYLTKTAVRKGGHYAAGILERYLQLSEANALPGCEIALFRGLGVDRRFEIGQGVFIAPYAEIVDQGLLRERKEVPYESPPDYRKMGVAAAVRDLTWGPGIKPPMTSKTPIGESIPDVSFPCLGDREDLGVIFDFLSVLTRCELDILSVQYRGADFMEEIEPNFKARSTTALVEISMLRTFRTTDKSLEAEHADKLREAIRDWPRGQGILGHVLRRLASSVARTGRFRLEDSILDLSIALEIMYGIDLELTYKLGTRVGYFLGSDTKKRNEIFDSVRRFYGVRSAIVHGRRKTCQELEQAFSEGFEMGRDTLFKLLRTKIPQDSDTFWNSLVMTGKMPSSTTETGSH